MEIANPEIVVRAVRRREGPLAPVIARLREHRGVWFRIDDDDVKGDTLHKKQASLFAGAIYYRVKLSTRIIDAKLYVRCLGDREATNA
jgi:hypothetical protein